jgi:hypothetical protein
MKGGLRTLEKLVYLAGVPVLLGYAGFTLYRNAILQDEERQLQLQEMEDKYLKKHEDHIVKLENFKKKVYAIGVYDPQLQSGSKSTLST